MAHVTPSSALVTLILTTAYSPAENKETSWLKQWHSLHLGLHRQTTVLLYLSHSWQVSQLLLQSQLQYLLQCGNPQVAVRLSGQSASNSSLIKWQEAAKYASVIQIHATAIRLIAMLTEYMRDNASPQDFRELGHGYTGGRSAPKHCPLPFVAHINQLDCSHSKRCGAAQSACDLQRWLRRLFYFLRSPRANLARKHTDNWINWKNKHNIMVVICQLYIIEATDLTTQHISYTYCGHSFTTIKTHYYCIGAPEGDIHIQCYPGTHEKLYLINSWGYYFTCDYKRTEGRILVDRQREMRFWCEQPGCCSLENCHIAELCGVPASCVSLALLDGGILYAVAWV